MKELESLMVEDGQGYIRLFHNSCDNSVTMKVKKNNYNMPIPLPWIIKNITKDEAIKIIEYLKRAFNM